LQTEVKFDSSSVQLTDIIQLYNNPSPNPRLYVVTNQATNLEWRIVNSIGQLVRTGRYGTIRGSNMYDFDLSNLSRGVYILDVRMGNDGQRKVFKLVR
jgi:hypothetical protein